MKLNPCCTLQVVELDFLYPSEGLHRRWESGYRITSSAGTPDQAAFILSIPKRKPLDETQETLRTSAFPSNHVKVPRAFLSARLQGRAKPYVSHVLISAFTEPNLRNQIFSGKVGEEPVHRLNLLRANRVLTTYSSLMAKSPEFYHWSQKRVGDGTNSASTLLSRFRAQLAGHWHWPGLFGWRHAILIVKNLVKIGVVVSVLIGWI